MSFIAIIKSFTRKVTNGKHISESVVDQGGGVLTTVQHLSASGDDSPPLPEDPAACMSVPRSGGHVVVATVDTKNEGVAVAGEKRIYARDSDGVIVVSLHLKADGSAVLANANGAVELLADGNVHITGNLTVDGEITAKASGTLPIDLSTHKHGFTDADDNPSITEVPQ